MIRHLVLGAVTALGLTWGSFGVWAYMTADARLAEEREKVEALKLKVADLESRFELMHQIQTVTSAEVHVQGRAIIYLSEAGIRKLPQFTP